YTQSKQDSQSGSDGFALKEAIHTSEFWLVMAVFFCVGFSGFSVIVHIVPHAIKLGISAVTAANILAISGGIGIIGNFLLGGLVGDKIGNQKAFIIGMTLMAASVCSRLLPSESSRSCSLRAELRWSDRGRPDQHTGRLLPCQRNRHALYATKGHRSHAIREHSRLFLGTETRSSMQSMPPTPPKRSPSEYDAALKKLLEMGDAVGKGATAGVCLSRGNIVGVAA
ncbi:MAG: MFS transporter, partial [Ktedonobacterales bacterium]